MLLRCEKRTLVRAFAAAASIVPSRTALPILEQAVITAEKTGEVHIVATNLQSGVRVRVAADVAEPGSVAAPARLLANIVRELPDELVTLHAASTTLRVHCGTFSATLHGKDVDDFPMPPPSTDAPTSFSLAAKRLRTVTAQTAFAAAENEQRPQLMGVCVRREDDRLALIASDGHRLSRCLLDVDPVDWRERIVPAKALSALAQLLPADETPVAIKGASRTAHVFIVADDVEGVIGCIDGAYPDIRSALPPSAASCARIDRDAFAQAIRLALWFSPPPVHRTLLRVMAGTAEIRASAADVGDGYGAVDAALAGDPVTTLINGRYLADAVAAIQTPSLALAWTGPDRPLAFRQDGDDSFLHVVLPLV